MRNQTHFLHAPDECIIRTRGSEAGEALKNSIRLPKPSGRTTMMIPTWIAAERKRSSEARRN